MIDVLVDVRQTRRTSLGVRACLNALKAHLPARASDLRLQLFEQGENFGWREQVALPSLIARERPSLVYYASPFVPLLRPRPYVLQVYDLIHLCYPHLFSPAVAAYYATLGRLAITGARRIVVSDGRVAAQIRARFGVSAERCSVVPLGYDPAMLAIEGREVRERPYVLYAGNRRPHKNFATLLDAWQRLPGDVELDLCVTGPPAGIALTPRMQARRRVVALGEVDTERLWRLYRGALAYVHPALMEGFGLGMLEALVVKTPVIASREAVSELVAPFAIPFNATDASELAAAIERTVRNPKSAKALACEGARFLRPYTWDRFVTAISGVLRAEVAGLRA